MADLDSIIINLKACLVSTKNGIPLNQIENDYFKVIGERILYKKLGFLSLEALLQDSGQFIIQNHGGLKIVQAVATVKTQHLTDLIKRQKSKPPKKNKNFIANRTSARNFNASIGPRKPNHYSRQGTNGSSYGPPRTNFGAPVSKYIDSYKPSVSYNNSRPNNLNNYSNKPHNAFDQNNYSKSQPVTNNYISNTYQGNHQQNTAPQTKGTHQFNINDKFHSKPEQKLPLTSSCSSLESTNSSSSTSYVTKRAPLNSMDKFQSRNIENNTSSQIYNKNDKDKTPKNSTYMLEKSKSPTQSLITAASIPSQLNMPIKPSSAQSRFQKYPKKCDESSNKLDNKEKSTEEVLFINNQDLVAESENPIPEDIEDTDCIEELELYLKNLNLSEPFYECMVKKEKSGRSIKLTHICTVKVNEKSVSSSFPVECSTIEYAKKVAAKHALSTLKKQYGENKVYPITNDINEMASRIKEFLKFEYQETGLMGDVLEQMYREKFQENLPKNWVQLLEVFSYFMFDKLVANKIIIYISDIEGNHHNDNGCSEVTLGEQEVEFTPGTPLAFENYDEKSVLVSANYGSASVWIRFVGQSADENFIQMQAKFNNAMNKSIHIAETVVEGEYYAVLYNSTWHRVQASSSTEEDMAVTCFMVDTGESLTVFKDQICYLEPVFMKTKTQAIQCYLTQLVNFDQFSRLKEIMDEIILNKTFFLIPDSLEDVNYVTLYEKKGADRININELIAQKFLEKTIARLPSFEENAVVDAIVSSCPKFGYLYLQLNFDVVESLEYILPRDEHLDAEWFLKSKEDIKMDHVYLLKYDEENLWCRAQVLEIINDSEVNMIYIDYGNQAKCEITRLFDLNLLDPLMAKIPPQAIKVSMNLLPPNLMTDDISNKIMEIVGDDKVLVNLINVPTNDVPCIQLYKTQLNTDIPLCINIQLAQSLKKQ